MGLIKTAMMSGAAIYGINKLSKAAAQSRDNNDNSNTSSRREYSDREYDQYHSQPLESSNRHADDRYLPSSRDMQNPNQAQYPGHYTNEPTQRFYLEEQAPQQSYNGQETLENPPQYAYAASSRSASASPLQFNYSANRQRGFVEREDGMGESRESQRGTGADMIERFAQQAMNMGMMGGSSGQKDKQGKADLIQSLMRK
jgi:hypothetical protein